MNFVKADIIIVIKNMRAKPQLIRNLNSEKGAKGIYFKLH